MTRILALTLLTIALSSSMAAATNFAVLLGEPPEPDDDRALIANPLAVGGLYGDSPMFDTQTIGVDPFDAWPGIPATLKLALGNSLPRNLPHAPARSLVFEVSLIDAEGAAIHELADPLTIWFTTTAPQGTQFTFGTLNESTGQWEQMAVIKKDKDNLLCGTTDHLSYFYLGPGEVPEPSA